jgi:heme-binding protein
MSRKPPLMRSFLNCAAFYIAMALISGLPGCSSTQAYPMPPAIVTTEPAVGRILAVSCYHCHWSEQAGTWYAKLQPSRWFGNSALEALDFSDWGNYHAARRQDAIRQVAAVVDAGTMPPAGYLLFHPQARLDPEQKAVIARWAAAQGAQAAH